MKYATEENHKLLDSYVNKVHDLTESLKRNLRQGGVIDEKTAKCIQEVTIASNLLNDAIDYIESKERTLN